MIYTALDTFYLKDEQIANSPSRKDNVDAETETTLRLYGCELIQEAGILLKLPQAVMATGQVLFHRFYCKKSLARFNVKRVSATCVWLAAKLEESYRKIPAILNVFHRLDRRREDAPMELLDPFSKHYEEMKTELISTERHLLKEMGFICHVEHPHKFIINYILQLDAHELMQDAWSMANDSLRTTLCVRFKSEVIACGVVYAASRKHRVPLPESPPWWEAFDAKRPDIEEVCRELANLYKRGKAKYIEVGRDVKPFVLTSRAWDPPPDVQASLLKPSANGAGPSSRLPVNSNVDGAVPMEATTAGRGSSDKSRTPGIKEAGKELDEAHMPSTNGDTGDPATGDKSSLFNDRVDSSGDKSGEKDSRDRALDRDRERDRDRAKARDRERERERDKEREKERERLKERDYRMRDRSRDSSHSDKSRRHLSTRDRDFQNLQMAREKDRHRYRHHPYA